MNIIPINVAEAIIQPFYDGGNGGDHTDLDPRYSVLSEYTIKTLNGAVGKIKQEWAFAEIMVDKTVQDKPVLNMTRQCDLDVSNYDTLMVFAGLSQVMRFEVDAIIDGEEQKIISPTKGSGLVHEFNGKFHGKHLTQLSFTFYCDESGILSHLCWVGLADSQRLETMLSIKPQIDPNWTGYFKSPEEVEIDPEINILFNSEELENIREKIKISPFKEIYETKKAQAYKDKDFEPERYIGEFVPYFDRRWCRTRDAKLAFEMSDHGGIRGIPENLAFVGLVEKDYELLKMAARHAFSLSHCTNWCESFMGILPGTTWHHRSFTESVMCKLTALVLDWCGCIMTPFGKSIIRNAIVKKGLPQIESDFRRVEYMREMNQGISFSNGRIYGMIALIDRYPRFQILLDEAEKDLVEMIGRYIQDDGGTLEGPGYWLFTFDEVSNTVYALARAQKKKYSDYKEVFEKTGEFLLAMLSTEDYGIKIIPVNDAHTGQKVQASLANAFYLFTDSPNWKYLYEDLMEKGLVGDGLFPLISSPKPIGKENIQKTKLNRVFPITGQVAELRQGKDLETLVHLCTGPTYVAHFHEDKGSLILEADKNIICPDPGTAFYHESDLFYIRIASSHNLLNPVRNYGELCVQGRLCEGGKVTKAEVLGNEILFQTETSKAWEKNPFEYCTRTIKSSCPEIVVVKDDFSLDNADYTEFILNCYGEFELLEDCAIANYKGIKLTVKPINWKFENAYTRSIMDGEHGGISQVVLPYKQSKKAELVTVITMERNIPIVFKDDNTIMQGEDIYSIID